jgi:hypothetical protein
VLRPVHASKIQPAVVIPIAKFTATVTPNALRLHSKKKQSAPVTSKKDNGIAAFGFCPSSRKANRRTHLVFNDGSHELHACFGHIPPASKGSVLVAIGESFGAPSNAKYGCVWRMMRFEPRRKPTHDVVP